MKKYKVGDKLKLIKNYSGSFIVGEIYTITNVQKSFYSNEWSYEFEGKGPDWINVNKHFIDVTLQEKRKEKLERILKWI